MGQPIAMNLLRAGYRVAAYARKPYAVQPLLEQNADIYHSPVELAQNCDVIITNVSETSDVESIVLGSDGMIHGLRAGGLVIDMSTISPEATRHIAKKLAEHNIDMLDAPVSGGPQGAIDGNLSIMVGGKKKLFEKALPLFQVIGKNITHIGDHGAGQTAKACNQLIVAQMMTAVAEAFIFAQASGVDPAKVREALMGGFASSRILEIHGQRMLSGDFTPGFKSKLHKKDLNIVMQEAQHLGLTLEATQLSQKYMEALTDNEADSSAIFTAIQTHNTRQETPS